MMRCPTVDFLPIFNLVMNGEFMITPTRMTFSSVGELLVIGDVISLLTYSTRELYDLLMHNATVECN
jgi:hypothetical protein